jgi:phosphoribosylformylglycinamidine synthase
VALAESCLWGDNGVRVDLAFTVDEQPWGRFQVDGILFGESQSRFLISFAMEASVQLRELADRHSVPLQEIGVVGGDRIVIDGALDVALAATQRAYEGALLDES